MELSATDRAAIAAKAAIGDAYLYQCLTGRKDMKADEAVRVERESGFLLRRWHLRSNDWWKFWPELIGSEGAPPVPDESVRPAAPAESSHG